MSIDYKIKLTLTADTPLPTIVKVELNQDAYAKLSEWTAGSDLFAVDEGTSIELSAQLSLDALTATPEGMEHDPALYLLVKEVPLPLTAQLSLTTRPRNEAPPEDRVYNPWSGLPGVYMDHQQESARVVVSIEGQLFTRYLYSSDVAKPYYYPLIGPHKKTLIQDGPDDHLHHHGLWWGHDDVSGHKLYHEFRGEGRQVHRQFLTLTGGPVFGQITALIDWLDENDKLLLQETRTVRIYNLPPESRYMDIATGLHAVGGDVTFGDTKEGGFPFIRVNEQISGHHTGVLSAAQGKRGEAEIFGMVTGWVDYSGKLFLRMNKEGDTAVKEYVDAGIACFSHPDNEDYASQWFVRDYGPFTPANFHFCGGAVLPEGDSMTMRHRLYVHAGNGEQADVQKRYAEYVSPAAEGALKL